MTTAEDLARAFSRAGMSQEEAHRRLEWARLRTEEAETLLDVETQARKLAADLSDVVAQSLLCGLVRQLDELRAAIGRLGTER